MSELNINIKVKDLIEIITEYDVYHSKIPSLNNIFYGMVNRTKREMYLDNTMSIEDRYKTTIHEVIHILYPKLKEKQVNVVEEGLYKVLFKENKETLTHYKIKENNGKNNL